MSEAVAFYATVRGRVQGVGFRDHVESRARSLSLTGYVRNGAGGRTVEVVAEGPREALEQLIAHMREGPRMSRVDAVDVSWSNATGLYDGFATQF
jgi:acylphosphatase